MYTIKHAAETTGVPVATLRAWERRYGIIAPARTESGYRLYDEASLATIVAMRDLVASGWSPKQAADHLATNPSVTSRLVADQPVADRAVTDQPVAEHQAATGTGPIGPVAWPVEATLIDALATLDDAMLATILDQAFSRGSYESVVDGWLLPALDEVGTAWADGRISVAGEHLMAAAVQRRLAAAYEAAANPVGGVDVIVGLPPGAHHELGIMAFATAARRAGLAVTYLGANLPAAQWVEAVEKHRAHCAVLAISRREDLVGVGAVVEALTAAHPGVDIAVGGRYQHLAPATTFALGHSIAIGARHLADRLTGRVTTIRPIT